MNKAGTRTALAALIGLALTVAVAVVPEIYFAYRARILRAVLETAVTLVGSLVAILCLGRYRRSRDLDDLVIVSAMLLIAVAFPVFGAIPLAIRVGPAVQIGHWAPLGINVMAAILLAMATTSWSRRSGGDAAGRPWARLLLPVGAVAALTVALVWLAPSQSRELLRPELSEAPDPFASPLFAAVEFGAAAFFAIAAARVAKAARTRGDPFLELLGIGSALMAVAGINYAMFPSFDPGLLNTGDLFRGAAVVAWAVGAIEEIAAYWLQVARLVRVEERRSLARDLHDGLAQELAFLVTHVQSPVDVLTDRKWLAQLKTGAERALAESRRAIAALTADSRPSLEADLGRTAHDIAGRGVAIDLDVAYRAVDPDYQETLVRIVREAVTNAIRHGRAHRVSIHFTGGSQPVLTVIDDGIGFDPAAAEASSGGFGMVCMRERAETLGATMAIHSAPGEGATVEIAWP